MDERDNRGCKSNSDFATVRVAMSIQLVKKGEREGPKLAG